MPEVTGRLRTPRLAAAPATPVVGELYYDTTTNGLYFWDGTSWVSTRSSAGTIYDSDPIGTVKGWSGKTVPTNWKLCDGATYTKAAFPQGWDFAKLQADAPNPNPLWTYTATDFTVPNFADRFILAPGAARPLGTRSQTNPALAFPGEETHQLLAAESGVNGSGGTGTMSADHVHAAHAHTGAATIYAGVDYNVAGQEYGANTGGISANHTHALNARNADSSHNNMPPYVVVAMIVKIAGAAIDSGGALVGPPGPAGADSTVPGPTGPTGPAGPGVPTGGTTNQVLKKNTATDFDTSWAAPSGGSGLPEVYVGADPPTPRDAQVIWIDTDASPMGSLNWNMEGWHAVGAVGEPAFQNSWANAGASVCGFRKFPDGKVKLKGTIQGGTNATVAFTLPAGYRPARDVVVAIPTANAASTGYCNIAAATGAVLLNVNVTAGTASYLDGVEFDTESVQSVASMAAQPLDSWHVVGAAGEPAFQNSWAAGASGPTTAFRKDPTGSVHIKGNVQNGTNSTTAFTLPAGYRPPSNRYFVVLGAGGAAGNFVNIDAAGNVVITRTGADVHLGEIEFDTESASSYATGMLPGPDSYYVRAAMSGTCTANTNFYPTLTITAQGGDGGAFSLGSASGLGPCIVARDAGTYLVTARPTTPSSSGRLWQRIYYGPLAAMNTLVPLDTGNVTAGAPQLSVANPGVVKLNAGEGILVLVFSSAGGAVGGEVEVTRLIQGAQGPAGPSTRPRVTALTPGAQGIPNPVTDGFEVVYVADAANGVLWTLRYNAGSASAYKWESVGGSPLESSWVPAEAGPQAGTNNNYERLANAVPTRFAVPLAGDYDFRFGASLQEISGSGAAADIQIRLFNDTTNATLGDANAHQETWDRPVGAYMKSKLVGENRLTLATAITVGVRGLVNSGSYASFAWYSAFLRATPVRVG